MNLYTLADYEKVKFSTTDNDEFLNKCKDLYEDVSDDDWESYDDVSEIPEILEEHGYIYNVVDSERILKIDNDNDLVNLYFKLQRFNPTINFDNGTALMLACNRLLNYYYDSSIKYIEDNENKVSLLQEIAGDDGMEQLNFHKSFRDTYGVSIY